MALADDDPYADYVKLTQSDTSSNHSWDRIGHWDDPSGEAPNDGKNYYVPAGMELYRPASTDTSFNLWKGGQLVLAGLFNNNVSASNSNGPVIPDLVLLGGSEIRLSALGPFAPSINNITTTVTVASSAASPALITSQLKGAINSNGGFRSLELSAIFKGDANSVLKISRPPVNVSRDSVEYGLFFWTRDYVFTQFSGTLVLAETNTILKPAGGYTYNWPNAALCSEGATLCLTNNAAFDNKTTNIYLRSFAVNGGCLPMGYKSSKLYPAINVTEGFSLEDDVEISAPVHRDTLVAGITAANPLGTISLLAHIGPSASLDLASYHLLFGSVPLPEGAITLRTDANGDGSRDVYWTYADVVTMNTANTETTSGSNIQYGAFEDGHASCWSNNETPAADSARHYWCKKKICFFYDTVMPNATLTISSGGMTWKAGAQLAFKYFNLYGGNSWGSWKANNMSNVPGTRTFTAEKFTVLSSTTSPANSAATIFSQGNVYITINADVYGAGGLILRNLNNQDAAVTLSHINTNYHGRLVITQQPKDGATTKHKFYTYLADARNWGGAYTAANDTWRSITITNFPRIVVTNDVAFTEPTRGMLIGGAQFTVNAGKTFTLSNQVTYAGELVKAGAGTLDLAGTARFINGEETTAPVAGTNMLNVLAGALKVSSKTAADGLAVTFEEGTRLIVPADTEAGYYNVKWDAPLTINTTDGKLPVEVEMTGNEGTGDITVPICTFNAAADIPETSFEVLRASNKFRQKGPVTTRTNGDGSVTYLATLGLVGTQLLIR